MKTKARVRFLNRVAHFEADIELADAVSRLATNQPENTHKLLSTINETRHPRLAHRTANSHNRELACKHLNATLRAAYFKDIYEELGHYISAVLRGCARKGFDGNRLIGNHPFSVEANKLFSLGSWDAVLDYLAAELFRKLEGERSTIKLITSFGAKLNLEFDDAVVKAALPYLELRHILVHRDGRIDSNFATNYPQFGLSDGDAFPLKHSEILNASASIHALVVHIDEKIVQNDLVPRDELQP